MQVSGRLLVLGTFAIGLAMAGGAWWYNYRQSVRAARFWGQDAQLIVGAETVELVEFAANDELGGEPVAGRNVASRFDLSNQRGLIHLRHALTYDGNFDWGALEPQAGDEGQWRRALRFAQDGRELVILFHADFGRLGRVTDTGRIEALPCPRLGEAIEQYLGRIGAAGFAPASAAGADEAAR